MENWLYEGFTAMISGMSAVFAVLILISFIISLFKHINIGKNKEITHKDNRLHLQAVVEENTKEELSMSDDLELVAVITAAIAASLNTTVDKLQVKSMRRISASSTKWKRR